MNHRTIQLLCVAMVTSFMVGCGSEQKSDAPTKKERVATLEMAKTNRFNYIVALLEKENKILDPEKFRKFCHEHIDVELANFSKDENRIAFEEAAMGEATLHSKEKLLKEYVLYWCDEEVPKFTLNPKIIKPDCPYETVWSAGGGVHGGYVNISWDESLSNVQKLDRTLYLTMKGKYKAYDHERFKDLQQQFADSTTLRGVAHVCGLGILQKVLISLGVIRSNVLLSRDKNYREKTSEAIIASAREKLSHYFYYAYCDDKDIKCPAKLKEWCDYEAEKLFSAFTEKQEELKLDWAKSILSEYVHTIFTSNRERSPFYGADGFSIGMVVNEQYMGVLPKEVQMRDFFERKSFKHDYDNVTRHGSFPEEYENVLKEKAQTRILNEAKDKTVKVTKDGVQIGLGFLARMEDKNWILMTERVASCEMPLEYELLDGTKIKPISKEILFSLRPSVGSGQEPVLGRIQVDDSFIGMNVSTNKIEDDRDGLVYGQFKDDIKEFELKILGYDMKDINLDGRPLMKLKNGLIGIVESVPWTNHFRKIEYTQNKKIIAEAIWISEEQVRASKDAYTNALYRVKFADVLLKWIEDEGYSSVNEANGGFKESDISQFLNDNWSQRIQMLLKQLVKQDVKYKIAEAARRKTAYAIYDRNLKEISEKEHKELLDCIKKVLEECILLLDINWQSDAFSEVGGPLKKKINAFRFDMIVPLEKKIQNLKYKYRF